MNKKTLLATTLLSALVCAAPALAQTNNASGSKTGTVSAPAASPAATGTVNGNGNGTANSRATTGNANAKAGDEKDSQHLVDRAVAEVRTMEKDPQLKKLMAKAKGIFLVPDFGRGAFIIGGRGGAGLVLSHKDGKWSNPAFYDIGGISLGAQVGGAGGPIAFLLMDQSAVDAFKSGNKFSLNAGAGLSIVTYSAASQASWGKGDIILWSNTKGAYVGATVSVSDVNWDDDNNAGFYGRKVTPADVLEGKVTASKAAPLKSALPG